MRACAEKATFIRVHGAQKRDIEVDALELVAGSIELDQLKQLVSATMVIGSNEELALTLRKIIDSCIDTVALDCAQAELGEPIVERRAGVVA